MSDPRFDNEGSIEIQTIEECAERIHALCKVQRFGAFRYHPQQPKVSNLERVLEEIDDVERRITNLRLRILNQIVKHQGETRKEAH